MTPFEIIAQATQAIAANPSDAAAYKQRAIILCQMRQFDDAMADLDMLADTLRVDDAEVFQLRGTLRMNRGDKTGALDDMRKALDLNPALMQNLCGEFKTQ